MKKNKKKKKKNIYINFIDPEFSQEINLVTSFKPQVVTDPITNASLNNIHIEDIKTPFGTKSGGTKPNFRVFSRKVIKKFGNDELSTDNDLGNIP